MPAENPGSSGNAEDYRLVETHMVPVIQEQLVVGTEHVETGSVRITKQVYEEQATAQTVTRRQEVKVERIQINRIVDTAPAAVRQEGDVTIISVVKEVLVTEKRLMLVEEVHVTKQEYQEIKPPVSQILRKEEITISRSPSGTDID